MKKFFSSATSFLRAVPYFVVFELLLKLFLLAIGAPILAFALKYTMKVSGVAYLSDENLLIYLQNPTTLFAFILLVFFVAFFTFVELSALVTCFSCAFGHRKISISGMMTSGVHAFVKAFRWSGIPKFLVFMLFMPIVQFTFASGQFLAPLMPIARTIFKSVSSTAGIVAYILIQVLSVILIVDKCYSLHYLILTENKFSDCIKKSRSMIMGKKFKMTVSLFGWSLFMLAVIAVLTLGIGFLSAYIIKGFSEPAKAFRTALKLLNYAVRALTVLSSFLSVPAVICWITYHFFIETEKTGEELIIPDCKSMDIKPLKKVILIIVLVVSGVFLNLTYLKALYHGNINLNMGIITRTQVTAHRGFSAVAPENTMYAFESAVKVGADYIELDVQLTADGELVVFHDNSLERTTDGEGKISDYTYEELQELSAGKWFDKSGEFDDARIVLLSDVLENFGRYAMFNIEIKNHGNVSATAEKTVQIIEEYNLEKSCYITSFSYSALKKVKKLNPKIKTGLIANVATSTSFAQLKYIDAVSLNYLFINQSIVNMAHQNGKRVFVWTVDRKSDMQHMIAIGVDNIITNVPDSLMDIVYSKSVGETVLTILETIFGS